MSSAAVGTSPPLALYLVSALLKRRQTPLREYGRSPMGISASISGGGGLGGGGGGAGAHVTF